MDLSLPNSTLTGRRPSSFAKCPSVYSWAQVLSSRCSLDEKSGDGIWDCFGDGWRDLKLIVDSGDYLSQMMTSVDLVKPSPLLRGQRTENRVVEQAGAGSEALLGIRECRIHGDQCIVKATKRFA